jgi:hypothetical protein
MMGRALLIIGALATLGLIASGALGYLVRGSGEAGLMRHVVVSLAACLAQLFAHSWILVYLWMTGRALRQTVAEQGLEASLLEPLRQMRAFTQPWILLALVLGLGSFVLGGAVASGAAKAWMHHVLAGVALVTQVWALWQESRVLRANQALIEGLAG